MVNSELNIGVIVQLQSGGPVLTVVHQTPYVNTFGYFDNLGVYHTFEVPNREVNDAAFKEGAK